MALVPAKKAFAIPSILSILSNWPCCEEVGRLHFLHVSAILSA